MKFKRLRLSSTRLSFGAFSVGPPMPGIWGPPPMMYPPCPPWAGWYELLAPPPPMHFHPRWLGPTEGFGHGGYDAGDDRYGSLGH
jgi:hypothetical protein